MSLRACPASRLPRSEDGGLVRAAIRHVRDQTGLDLSACDNWLRVADVTYIRSPSGSGSGSGHSQGQGQGGSAAVSMHEPGCSEVVTLFVAVPDACVAGPEAWPEEARAQQAFKQQRLALEAAEAKKRVSEWLVRWLGGRLGGRVGGVGWSASRGP